MVVVVIMYAPYQMLVQQDGLLCFLLCRRKWPDLLSLCSRCYLGSHLLSPPCKTHDKYTLATAYNTALATYKVVGPEHEDAVAAVAAALHLDQGRWVPLLMAGGVLGTAVMGPLMPLGGKEEATVRGGLHWQRVWYPSHSYLRKGRII